ncbi:protein-S-isoprenylcysteine methyltransferase [Chryseobacterium sp. T16E-39]|uniref:methyltransferase family protein n=1 Tax=Chryseobacterium sp. T16E-39 TaxID=2015076 RepID=UPI000B5B3586|nr:isoprenylcysteine carboxylmethyltransferase family protein [Chryseobacterium sp. T16E-39]ASK31264.1 protein-S-isoprenylcysteine methyltransferase [Chryseobacterium sp. T16E-39]
MNLQILFYASMGAWLLTEIIYKQKLKSADNDQKKDQSTLNLLWVVIILSIAGAVTTSNMISFPISDSGWIFYLGEGLILLGIVFRLIIIRSLGKYFTVDVTIKEDHKIKKEGFYRYLRHPSYAFSLLTFLGLGLYLNNWLSLVIAFIPPFLAFSYRIKIEEQVLIQRFGEEYVQYRKITKKLIPFLY